MRFQNKVVMVTGSGAGIGASAAKMFAKEGAKVVCNSVSESAKKVTEEIIAEGGDSIFIQGDVSKEEDAARLISQTISQYGRLDVLINNAGIVLGGTIDNTTMEDFQRTMDVNVLGTFLMSQKAVEEMRKQGYGVIVHVSSIAALRGIVNRLAYSASKGALLSLTRAMAKELAGENIRVNCVCPGTTMTPSLKDRLQSAPDPELETKNFCARQPMGRLGEPEEIAEAILFAASDQAGFMTGSIISIDGGMIV